MTHVLGIDIGGSGIKGAIVDLDTGEFVTPRKRIDTPKPATPEACAAVVAEIINYFKDEVGDGPIGLTVPGPVVHGVVPLIANLDKSWTDLNAEKFFHDYLGHPVTLLNDADAAGLAEVHYGAAKDHPGLVILTTLGTGIGSAIINRGVLVPNTELGHLEIDGHDAESRAAASFKEREGLSYAEWAKALQRYYSFVEMLFSPDLFVVGGGVSKDHDQFLPLLKLRTPIVPAKLRNKAGIVGAAWLAKQKDDAAKAKKKK